MRLFLFQDSLCAWRSVLWNWCLKNTILSSQHHSYVHHTKVVPCSLKPIKPLCCCWQIWPTQNDAKNLLKKILKPWHMGTHLRVLSESYLISTNITGFRWFSKILASLCFGRTYSQHWKTLWLGFLLRLIFSYMLPIFLVSLNLQEILMFSGGA